MRKDNVNTFKLGLFVTIATLLFVFTVYLIGNEQNMFRPTFQLHAVFQNVEGLKRGNIVRYAGIDVGVVQEVQILSDSTLRVAMVLQKGMQPYIRKNAVASIGSDGLVGGSKIVNISPGTGNETAASIDDLDIIRTYNRPDTDDMIEVLGKTNENLALFSGQLLEIAKKVNSAGGTANLLLEDATLASDLRQTVSNLRYTSQALRGMGVDMQQALTELNEGDGLLHELLYDTTIMADLKATSGTFNQMATQDLEPILLDLRQSVDNINQVSATARDILQQIDSGQGALGTLLRDPGAEQDLKETLDNINQSAQRFNENMEAMRHNFLFRKYFKKLEKENPSPEP
ncbi:MAG: MlaD family protein [Saprospiraceae bacterium]|nr:MCE family protein [Lewinella sp.]